jgi:hypothetical protein
MEHPFLSFEPFQLLSFMCVQTSTYICAQVHKLLEKRGRFHVDEQLATYQPPQAHKLLLCVPHYFFRWYGTRKALAISN